MRNFTLFAFCCAVVFASAVAQNPFQVGSRRTTTCFGDKLAIKQEVRVHNKLGAGKFFDKTFEKIEVFTPGNGARITFIKATDLKKNGAAVNILSGGIGQTSVTLEFRNKGHGLHFNVEIYATKK